MLDFQKAIVSSIFECIDNVGTNLVAHTYHNIVDHYGSVIWLCVTLYVGFIFIQAMQGQKSFYDLLNTLFRIVIILTLALNYDYFCLFIYDIFTKEPLMIMKTITINSANPAMTSINQALDNYLNLGLHSANKLFLMGSWSNLTYLIFALLVFIMTVFGTIFAAGLIILSKCALVILLALSPLFIIFALFDMTRGIFESYIRHLFTYALIPILTSAVLMILLSVSDTVMQFMNQFPKVSFMSVAPFLLMGGIQIYLFTQVLSKASALGAGFALPGLVSSLRQVKGSATSVANTALGGLKLLNKARSIGKSTHTTITRMGRFSK